MKIFYIALIMVGVVGLNMGSAGRRPAVDSLLEEQ
jgi:hypothetical protein